MSSDNLVYMVNQIARNLAAQGEAKAIAATADHIRRYWDPRMVEAILSAARTSLSPIASGALAELDSTKNARV